MSHKDTLVFLMPRPKSILLGLISLVLTSYSLRPFTTYAIHIKQPSLHPNQNLQAKWSSGRHMLDVKQKSFRGSPPPPPPPPILGRVFKTSSGTLQIRTRAIRRRRSQHSMDGGFESLSCQSVLLRFFVLSALSTELTAGHECACFHISMFPRFFLIHALLFVFNMPVHIFAT